MARYQIAPTLQPADKRVAGIVNELLGLGKCPFLSDFVARYRVDFALEHAPKWEALQRALEGAPKPLRSQEQEQEQEKEQEHPASSGSRERENRARAKPEKWHRVPEGE